MSDQSNRHLEILKALIERVYAQLSECADHTDSKARDLHKILLPLLREYRMTANAPAESTKAPVESGTEIQAAPPAPKAEPNGRAASGADESKRPQSFAPAFPKLASGLEILPDQYRYGNRKPDYAVDAVAGALMAERENAASAGGAGFLPAGEMETALLGNGGIHPGEAGRAGPMKKGGRG